MICSPSFTPIRFPTLAWGSMRVVGFDEDAVGDPYFMFDRPTALGGTTYKPGDIVRYDGVGFSPYFQDAGFPAGAAGTDVTGGIAHRVGAAVELARAGTPSVIADGTVPGLAGRALTGEDVPGTRVTSG